MTETQTAPMAQVKALEWEKTHGYVERAKTPFGWLTVEDLPCGEVFYEMHSDELEGRELTLFEAKAAAQADFERRVLACLNPAPATLADETLRAEVERLTIRAEVAEAELMSKRKKSAKLAALATAPAVPDRRTEEVALGRFGHHPDASTDFCIEVEALEGWLIDMHAGLRSQWPFWARLSRLLKFEREEGGGLDAIAQKVRPVVRELEKRAALSERRP